MQKKKQKTIHTLTTCTVEKAPRKALRENNGLQSTDQSG